jgi:hypothetical protein
MTKTTDNLPPIGRETILVDKNGRISQWAHNFLTAARDQALGRNRVSDTQFFSPTDSISPISELLRVASSGGEHGLANPQILSSFDGHEITLNGTSDDNPLALTNGNGVLLKNKEKLLLKNGTTAKLHHDAEKNLWIELGDQKTAYSQILEAKTAINPVGHELIRVESTGGKITLTSNPQILAGYDGQKITIEGMSDPNSITVVNGNGVVTKSGSSIEFKNNVVASFHYTASKTLWIEN